MLFFSAVLVLRYLVASHAVAVENADFLILLAGHVVQALVGLHITDLSRIHTQKPHEAKPLPEHRTTPFDSMFHTPYVCLDFSQKVVNHRCVCVSNVL